MGSFFAGIKAGTLGGALYVGGLAVFNVAVLYALKSDVLASIQQSYPQLCGPAALNTTLEDCFNSVVAVDVPYVAFVGFFVVLLYAGILGMYFEAFPGKTAALKGTIMAFVVAVNLVFLGFSGFYFDYAAVVATTTFLFLWTPVFGYLLGRLYKKYTRLVSFTSQDPDSLRIRVDGHDVTGKSRTYAFSSTHKVRAEVAEDASFQEWEASGGISAEDSRSFETLIEVNGDGGLSARVGKKY